MADRAPGDLTLGGFSTIRPALNAGEWTPRLEGRVDLAGYTASCKVLENTIPTIQGPGFRRSGTLHTNKVKDNAERTWLVPFIRSRKIAYQIEFGDLYCRFYQNRAPLLTGSPATISAITQADPAVITTLASHGFSAGDDIFITGIFVGPTQLNGRWFRVANPTATTFELQDFWGNDFDTSALTLWANGGTIDKPYEIVSPYALADLTDDDGHFMLDFVQDSDVMYITNRLGTYLMRKLSRLGTASFAFTEVDPDNGPFQDANGTDTTLYADAATGSGVTITASTATFNANMVGGLVRIDQEIITATSPWLTGTAYGAGDYVRSEGREYQSAAAGTSGTTIPSHVSGTVSDGGVAWAYISPGYGIGRVTAQTATTLTVDVLTAFPQTCIGSGNASTNWRLGAWSVDNGYPEVVAFFKQRLCTGQNRQIEMSEQLAFESFAIDNFGEIVKTNALSIPIKSDTTDDIVGLTTGEKVLTAHTIGGEHVVSALTLTEAFGPGNTQSLPATTYGARPIRPFKVGEAILYVQSSGRKMREQTFDFNVDTYVARDMMVRAEHLTTRTKRLIAMARAEEPHQLMYLLRDDGVVLVLTYDRTQEVRGWGRLVMGGPDAFVEAISVIPTPEGDADELWMIVRRTINGQTVRYVEHSSSVFEEGDDVADAQQQDSALTYDGTSAQTVYGYDHLIGEELRVLQDGAAHPNVTVASDGTIVFARAGEKMQAGFPTRQRIQWSRIDGGGERGTAQTKIKRIHDVALRVLRSRGGETGPDWDNLVPIADLNYRNPATPMGTPEALFSGDAIIRDWPGDYDTDGFVCYQNDTAFPSEIVAIVPTGETNESK